MNAKDDINLQSDDIRRREKIRRREGPLWSILSFAVHAALFAAIVFFTPVRKLVFEDKETPPPNPAEDLSADRLEELSDRLEEVHQNELLDKLDEMQTVLHNMEMMKNELLEDYDDFAEENAKTMKDELEKLIDDARKAQAEALKEQPKVEKKVEELVREEQKDVTDEERQKKLRELASDVMMDDGAKVVDEMAKAANALDKMEVQASFVGLKETAKAAEKAREEQKAVAAKQDEAQRDTNKVAAKLAEAFNHKREMEKSEAKKKEQEERLAKAQEKGDERQQNDAKKQIADAEKRIGERKESLEAIEKVRRENANRSQVERLEKVRKEQEELAKRMDAVKETLAKDRSSLEKLASGQFEDSEMVRRNVSSMKIAEAYELAKEMEVKITETYKDIKATETAIRRRMSYDAAQKLTDVAHAERMELSEETKAALEARVRTKSALDAQKTAESEVMREAKNIAESSLAMMEDAMSIVKPDPSSGQRAKSNRRKGNRVDWLTDENFKNRDSAEKRSERLASMKESADYQLALSEAAAEDESQRVKNVAAVVKAGTASKHQEGGSSGGLRPNGGAKDPLFRGGGPGPLQGKMPELMAGNVMRFGALPKGVGEDRGGIPAKWMYINSWYVIGPFPNPNRVNIRRKFPPESVVDLDASYPGKDGQMVKWRFMQAQSTELNWWGAVAKARVKLWEDHQYEIWYAYAEVFSDVEGDVWLAVGSDDRSDVWLNGASVWESSNKLKAWNISEGFRLVHLKRGRNKVLMRIENGWGPIEWSLCFGVGDNN